MGAITDYFANAFRDFVTAGVPASGPHDPVKSEIRAIGPLIEQAIATAAFGSVVTVVKSTRALLDVDLAHANATVALVYADPTDANNDLYVKNGASGAGSWVLTNALHGAVASIGQQNGGRYVYGNRTAGSTNDVIAITTESGVPVTSYRLYDFYVFNVTGMNTVDTPTLSINGLPAKPLRSEAGGVLEPGYYQDGTHLAVRYDANADEFRIMFRSPVSITQRGAYCTFTQSNTSGFMFEGTVSPDPIPDIFAVLFSHKITVPHVESGVSYLIPEFISESRQLKTVDGAQISPGTWSVGDTVLFRYVTAGNYELVSVLKASPGSGSGAAGTSQQSFNTRANSGIYALRSFGK